LLLTGVVAELGFVEAENLIRIMSFAAANLIDAVVVQTTEQQVSSSWSSAWDYFLVVTPDLACSCNWHANTAFTCGLLIKCLCLRYTTDVSLLLLSDYTNSLTNLLLT
jgi:hypothetical protein